MEKLIDDHHHVMDTTLSGSLFFDGVHPGVKTATESFMLHMPDFFRYAYFEGIKQDTQVKVRGLVRESRVKGEHSVIHARELSIGNKTFHVVSGSPHHDCHLRSLESAVHPLCPYHIKSLEGAAHPSVSLF